MSNPTPVVTPKTKPTKAIVSALTVTAAILGSLVIAVTAGSDGGTSVTIAEWLQAATVGVAGALGTFGVYQVTNAPKGE